MQLSTSPHFEDCVYAPIIQELGYGVLQPFCTTQVPSEHLQVETLEPSTVTLHHSIPMWGSGSPHRGWILQGISQILSLFNSTMALATPVTTPFNCKIHLYSHLLLFMMAYTPALFLMIKALCRLCILESTPTNTLVC